MECIWMAKRVDLWQLLQQSERQSDAQLAHQLGMSRSWVQKWRPRVRDATGDDITIFLSQSRRRESSPRQVTEPVEAKILHLREYLTEQYGRRVGAHNILYHLQNDPDLKQINVFIPHSHTTVHDVLVRFGRVPRPKPRVHVPRELAEPLQVWEMDFTDVVTAKSPDSPRRQHQVEVFDVIDTGSSVVLETRVSDHFDAEWSLVALIDVLRTVGLPKVLRFDRDPRFIASWTMDAFPSAMMRVLLCLGVRLDVCPPRRPDHKPSLLKKGNLDRCWVN